MASTVTRLQAKAGSNGCEIYQLTSDGTGVATDIAIGFKPSRVEIIGLTGTSQPQTHSYIWDSANSLYKGVKRITAGDATASTALTWASTAGGTLTLSTDIVTNTAVLYIYLHQ
jgi:hypothetical protein